MIGDFAFSDPDGNTLHSVRIDTLPASGTLQLDGVDVVAGDFIASTDISSGKLVYIPATNVNGAGATTFTFSVVDDLLLDDETPNTITVDINAVNDAPTLTNGSTVNLAGTNEDTASSGSSVASIFASASGDDVDAGSLSGIAVNSVTGNGNWQFSTDGTNWTDFGSVASDSALLLTSTTQVRYEPDGIDGETATFGFIGWDQTVSSGSTFGSPNLVDPAGLQGGSNEFSTESASASMVVTAVNDAVIAVADTGSATESGGVANATAGSNGTGNVLANDTEVDPGDTLNVTGIAAGNRCFVQHGRRRGGDGNLRQHYHQCGRRLHLRRR